MRLYEQVYLVMPIQRRSSRALKLTVTVLTATVVCNMLPYEIHCVEFDFIFASEILVD